MFIIFIQFFIDLNRHISPHISNLRLSTLTRPAVPYLLYLFPALFLHLLVVHHVDEEPLQGGARGFRTRHEHIHYYTERILLWK